MSSEIAYEKGIHSVWVVGAFEGEKAKSVLAHGDAGIGYIILERGGNKFSPGCTAAFRIAPEATEGLPDHLNQVFEPSKIEQYEKIRLNRMGMGGRQKS